MEQNFYCVKPLNEATKDTHFKSSVEIESVGLSEIRKTGYSTCEISDISKDARNKVFKNYERLKINKLIGKDCKIGKEVVIDDKNGVYWSIADSNQSIYQYIKIRQYANSLFRITDNNNPITIVTDQCLFDVSGIIATDKLGEMYPVTNPYHEAPEN
ncbi:MAG: hypothetical protein AAGH46_12195, partial [Bacteroidota bacterium]